MNSSTPNAEPYTPEEEISQSIEKNSEPDETSDSQTPGNEPDINGEDNSDAVDNSSEEEDSDDEEETTSAVARRFERSRAPSPEDPSLRNGDGMLNSRRRDRGDSPPRSTIATGARLAASPSPHNADIPPRDPSADADGPPCDSTPDTGSDSGRADGRVGVRNHGPSRHFRLVRPVVQGKFEPLTPATSVLVLSQSRVTIARLARLHSVCYLCTAG